MPKNNGYIKLYRSIRDHWIWKKERTYSYTRAWIDLLLEASYKNMRREYKGDFYDLERGQMLYSLRYLAKKWNWTKNKVDRFLKLLQKDSMIELKPGHNIGHLTICNYNIYNPTQDTDEDSDGTLTGQQRDKYNKVIKKEVKNNIYIQVFDHWIKSNIIEHKKLRSIHKKKIDKVLKEYTVEEILESITNYGVVYNSDKYWFSYKWTLDEFLQRGLHKFLNEAKPLLNYLDKKKEFNKDDFGY